MPPAQIFPRPLVDVTGTGSFVNIPEGAKLTKNDDGTYTLTVPGATKDAVDIVTKLSGGRETRGLR